MAISRRSLILGSLALVVLVALVLMPAVEPEARPTLTIGPTTISVEERITPEEKQLGLSYRASLGESEGMLFVYSEDVRPGYWMKGMNFAIDIIWLDANWQIADITPRIAPETYPQAFYPAVPIRYVLEVNAGFVDKHSLRVGDQGIIKR